MTDERNDASESRPSDLKKISDPEEQLRQLVDTALDAVITCDTQSRILVWNIGAERLFGWSSEEAVGMRLGDTIIPPEMREGHNKGMQRYLSTGEGPVLGQRIEIEAVDRHGRRFPVELSINPIRTRDGLCFSGFIRDISDRIESERQIRDGEERLKLVLEAAEEGVWDLLFAEDGSITESVVSDRTRELMGRTAMLMPSEREGIHPEDLPQVQRSWSLLWSGEESPFELEYRLLRPDSDDYIWVRERGTIVRRRADGSPERAVGSVVNITQRKGLEAALLAAQKGEALGMLASGFAHDLNNILAAIQGHASLMKMAPGRQDKIAESLNVIDVAVSRGKSLTRNMLQLGRPAQVRKGDVDFISIVKEAVDLVAPAMPKNVGLDFEIRIPPGSRVHLSPEQLQQALLNLMINSRDAMPSGGKLSVVVDSALGEDGDPKGVISVIDTGCGMSEADQERVFQPFFTTKGQAGTGLGLAIVHGFILDNDGQINITSTPGEGTTIRIELPLIKNDASLPGLADEPAIAGDVRGRKVLLAEDHPLLRPMLCEAMEHVGYDVDVAIDGNEAEAKGLLVQPDVMVMDIDLPGRRGDDVARLLRESWKVDVPVVFITGNLDFARPDWPGVRLLRKPFDIEALIEAIGELLD